MIGIIEWDDLSFPERVIIRSKSTKSFLNFTRIWFELIQGDRLLVNWHHRLMASKIDDLLAGRLVPRNLIINIPPGGTKTEFFSIHFPAYVNALVQEKRLKRFRNLNISFADTLVKRNSRRTRDIIASREYQEFWPCSFGVNQAEEWEIKDERGRSIGQTVSRSSNGQITGGRGGYYGPEFSGMVMLDDYNKPVDMLSESRRKSANTLLVNTIRSRRGDKSKEHPTPFVSIQQRLHTDDATGFMLAGGMGVPFHHVAIPAMIDEKYIQSLDEPWRSLCWETVKDTDSVVVGGVRYWSYWPQMEDVNDLLQLWEKDRYTFLSQYQQNPMALTGGIIDTSWFRTYTTLPKLTHRAVYVDTNSGKVEDWLDYTVFTLAGMGVDGNLYIIDVVRGRWDPEDLLKKAEEVWEKWRLSGSMRVMPLRHMAIEEKQAGQGLITTLKKRSQTPGQLAIPVREIPRGTGQNKLVRCLNVIPQIKTGKVFVPATHTDDGQKLSSIFYEDGTIAGSTEWVLTAMTECAAFSADDSHDNDDILDTWMDAIDDNLISGPQPMVIDPNQLRRI
ncbi:TPA: phage terminase large subunit [Klebsiella pneumoniae subsp. pneumoniae]|jgi:predicted phage terminase large subunit-like protein|uniref:phage terminase large subunit n=1 Tax=Klebsiella pneumoniae complex TaxID=3390273 RepID=UPI0004366C17|nr:MULTISPECIES: phage terminase large subunit [Klebsiella]HBQ5785693.1 phage terminase large subunit [Klebsiella pneumoniae subsp. pneumoniae]EIX9246416.1 phage terminase large subunit [Klebsiella pneumoniae]EIX9589223.1 phage terminase large subunit [Klebsiella pneumoniae]MBD7861882.1 phage terminase large subunit [Klebsiella pneumoniae]UDC67312.1 phage terminase large subunit [Klebsiella quasipneumoniae subsp. quasipneumoniae]